MNRRAYYPPPRNAVPMSDLTLEQASAMRRELAETRVSLETAKRHIDAMRPRYNAFAVVWNYAVAHQYALAPTEAGMCLIDQGDKPVQCAETLEALAEWVTAETKRVARETAEAEKIARYERMQEARATMDAQEFAYTYGGYKT